MTQPDPTSQVDATPQVVALHIAKATRLDMIEVDRVEIPTGHGIIGDRYENARHRQVTVQSREQLDEAAVELGAPITPGSTRRNITIDHGDVPRRPGDRITIGDLELEVVRIAAPCTLLDDVIGRGAKRALHRRAGSVCRVLRGATVELGARVVLSPQPTDS